jgi:nicotinamidase/pyrazinamidase
MSPKVGRGEEIIPVINGLVPHFRKRIWTREDHDPHHRFFASSRAGRKPLDMIEMEY